MTTVDDIKRALLNQNPVRFGGRTRVTTLIVGYNDATESFITYDGLRIKYSDVEYP